MSEPRAPPSSYPGEHPARGRHAAFSSLLYSLIKQLAWPAIAPSDSHVSRRAALATWLKRAAASKRTDGPQTDPGNVLASKSPRCSFDSARDGKCQQQIFANIEAGNRPRAANRVSNSFHRIRSVPDILTASEPLLRLICPRPVLTSCGSEANPASLAVLYLLDRLA